MSLSAGTNRVVAGGAALHFERELMVSVTGILAKLQRLPGMEHEDGTPVERLGVVPPDELDPVGAVASSGRSVAALVDNLVFAIQV